MMNELLTYILGGGFISATLGLFTIRSRIKKIRAETESLSLDNSQKATEILMDNIVEPLKQELNETRKEMALLRTAIRDAQLCRYAYDCPVLAKLRDHKQGILPDREICSGIHDDIHSHTADCRGTAVPPD